MTVATKPSVGAIRAAQKVAAAYEVSRNFGRNASPYHEDLAAIISAETHDNELLEALEALLPRLGCIGISSDIYNQAASAILKAKEGR